MANRFIIKAVQEAKVTAPFSSIPQIVTGWPDETITAPNGETYIRKQEQALLFDMLDPLDPQIVAKQIPSKEVLRLVEVLAADLAALDARIVALGG